MKKFISKIAVSLVCVFCLITAFGCSCSKKFEVYYSVNVSEGENQSFDENLMVKAEVIQKFREPANTPCYKKVEDNKYELIQDASEVSECYTSEGQQFEKATHKLVESKVLSEYFPIYQETDAEKTKPSAYTSESIEFPLDYSLIYKFTIKNYNDDPWGDDEGISLYVKSVSLEELVGKSIKEESLSKVKVTLPSNVVEREGVSYYEIGAKESIEIIVEIKGLTRSDLHSDTKGKLHVSLNLFVTK